MSGVRSLPTLAICVAVLSTMVCKAVSGQPLVYGVDSNSNLVRFSASTPGTILDSRPITGMFVGESVKALDFRPVDGGLFALGNSSRLYRISPVTGVATRVGSPGAFMLNGSAFGMDFNPLVDRIRITSDANQNLRVNPDGTLTSVDSLLSYGPGDPNFGLDPSIVASAYTNNDPGSATTTLYGIDSGTNTLVIQNPPNNGTLLTVGALGIDTDAGIGFDIHTFRGGNTAYAAYLVAGAPSLFSINLGTGAATALGVIATPGAAALRSLAVSPSGGARTDFARSGRSAIAWRDEETGELALWFMNGGTIESTAFFGVPTSWTLAGTGDFNGDGRGDIFWRGSAGQRAVWFMDGGQITNSFFGTSTMSAEVAAVADVNGDGRADIAYRQHHLTDVPGFVTLMEGAVEQGQRGWNPGSDWRLETAADVDGDLVADLLWRDWIGGATAIWFMDGSAQIDTTAFFSVPPEWSIVGTGDVNGDGNADILWRRPSNGDLAVWFMNGATVLSTAFFNVPTSWLFIGTGDFDGDGNDDLLWRNPVAAAAAIWFMTGPTIASTAFYGVGFNWSIVAPLQ